MSQPNHANIKVEIVEIGHDDEFQYDDEDFFNLPLALDIEDKEEVYVDTFICNYCFVYFSSKSSLKFHLKNSHSELYGNIPTYACNICHNPRRYTREQDIRKHMRAIHNDEATDISCFIRKANPTKLNLQEKRVTNSTYKCIPCNKTYTRSQDIVKHMRFVHMKIGVDPNEYQCKDSLSLINFPEFKIITKVIYNCELCKELFSETDGLDLHMKQEHKLTVSLDFFIAHSVQAYACKLCDESFLSLHELRAHCFQEHGYEEHIFVCPECNEYFLFGSNMVRHLLQVHKEMGWKNKDLLRTIVKKGKEIIDKMFTLKCNVCNKYFKKDRDLYTHMQGFHPEKIDDFTLTEIKKKVNRFKINMKVICSQCDQTFSSKESLIDHLNDHSSNTHTPLCQKCNESLENHNALWSHIFSKHPLGPFVCSVCPLVLNHKVDLMKHIGEIHGILLILENPDDIKKIKNNCKIFIDGILKYKCEECPLIFDSFRSHQRHMYIHKGDTRIICDQCSKQFRSISSLKSHISHVHDNVRRFKCEYCGRAFTCQTNLVQHIRIHTGEKPYVCDECGNRYAQYASLYSHKLTHAQNYCHVCSECGRAFHRISRLKQHMRIHTGDRPPRSHMCDICHKGFRSNSERKRHQQIHNPVRSFVCETCGSRFTLKKYLIQHYKIHREVSEVCIETVTDLGFDVQV